MDGTLTDNYRIDSEVRSTSDRAMVTSVMLDEVRLILDEAPLSLMAGDFARHHELRDESMLPGKKVRVKRDLQEGGDYGRAVNVQMVQFRGQVVTLTGEAYISAVGATYHIQEDKGEWHWSKDMFEDTIIITKKERNKYKIVMTKEKEELVEVAEGED